MNPIVYADFTSPLSFVAGHRADVLRAAGIDVDWRAVEQAPRRPVTGRRLDATRRAALETEVADALATALPGERLDLVVPVFIPNTGAAVAAYAEAYGAGVADDVRRLLLRAYWNRGMDIGDPEQLRTPLTGPFLRGHSRSDPLRLSGYAVSVGRGPITTGAWRRLRAWRDEWSALGTGALPVLVDDAVTVSGPDVPRHLGKMIARLGVPPDPELPDPERYPESAPAPAGWAGATGGRWLYPWRR